MEVKRVDVAIVGAGPAGSTLAALLATRGVDVALIDRDRFPRDKLCGEFLSYDALPIVERLDIDLAGTPEIRTCRVVTRRGTYEFPFPRSARGISRFRLDAALATAARRRGADVIEGVTVDAIDATSVTAGSMRFDAKAVVGAWGRWGRFDTQLRRAWIRDHTHRSFGFKRHYRRRIPATDGAIDLYSFSRGYLGVNDVEDGVTNICGLVHASRLEGHKGRWDAFVERIRSEEASLDHLYNEVEPAQNGFLSSEPVIFRARSAVEGGVFMIGDAAGIIDPLTGNGMAMAMQSAVILAPYLLRVAEDVGRRESIENAYREEHRRTFLRRIRWSRTAAWILSKPQLLTASARALPARAVGRLFLDRTRGEADRFARMIDGWT